VQHGMQKIAQNVTSTVRLSVSILRLFGGFMRVQYLLAGVFSSSGETFVEPEVMNGYKLGD